jgi:multicomponent Na+:H+ antiporter subunit E
MTASRPIKPNPLSATAFRSGLRLDFGLGLQLVVLAGLWLVLAGSNIGSWIVGAPTVLAALWIVRRESGGGAAGWSVWGFVQFLPYFLWESFRGGIDVAGRVVGRRVDVDPGYHGYRLALAKPAARVFFLDVVSLLPGTLSADIDGDRLLVHMLDRRQDPSRELARLERRVAAVFGERLAETAGIGR